MEGLQSELPFRGMRRDLPAWDCAVALPAAESESVYRPVLERMIKGWLLLLASALVLGKRHPPLHHGDVNTWLQLVQERLGKKNDDIFQHKQIK